MKIQIAISLVLILWLSMGCQTTPKNKLESSYTSMKSADGSIIAHFLRFGYEGIGKTFLEKDRMVRSTINLARPMAWHPTRNILVLREVGDDDDNSVFVLNLDRDEWAPEGERLDYIIRGTRFINQVSWSEDGNTLILTSSLKGFEEHRATVNLD